jgi:hypothetical protein
LAGCRPRRYAPGGDRGRGNGVVQRPLAGSPLEKSGRRLVAYGEGVPGGVTEDLCRAVRDGLAYWGPALGHGGER